MFDVGFWEVSLIGLLALIIIGPERLPGVARTVGTWMGKARRMMTDIKTDIKSELDETELDQLKSIGKDIQDAGEAFKSQVESGEEKLKTEGSAMDNAIADALNKPMTTADPNWAYPADEAASSSTDTKASSKDTKAKSKTAGSGTKKSTRKKTSEKKVARKKTSAKKNTSAKTATAKTSGEAIKKVGASKKVTKKKAAKKKATKKATVKATPKSTSKQTT